MKSNSNRRQFMKGSAILACSLIISGKLSAFTFPEDEIPDPKKLNYCGHTCPKDCPFKVATVKNDTELKKKAYETWKIKERYGFDFDANTSFCWGCKTPNKPAGVAMASCTVRACAIENEYDSCIECKKLKTCDKDIWSRFPSFHESVLKMQQTYFKAKV